MFECGRRGRRRWREEKQGRRLRLKQNMTVKHRRHNAQSENSSVMNLFYEKKTPKIQKKKNCFYYIPLPLFGHYHQVLCPTYHSANKGGGYLQNLSNKVYT